MGFKDRLIRNPFFWATVAGLVLIPLLRPMFRHEPEPPPVLWKIPEFSLTSQDGKPFGSSDLNGHVYVMGFFFTSCKSICPRLTKAIRKLQERYQEWKSPVRIVFITIDPQNDTPRVLAEYGKKYGIDFRRWTLLTGDEGKIRTLIEKGFRSHVGRAETKGGVRDIAHTGHVALIDADGHMRGSFGTDPEGLDEVFHRSQHVWLSRNKAR